MKPPCAFLSLFGSLVLAGCAIMPAHRFALPARDWQTRIGQLSYHNPRRTMVGEVLVRYSSGGDLELTFTKGPGLTLLLMKTDAQFVRVQGPLIGLPWSGPPSQAPARVRGWLRLAAEILHEPRDHTFRVNEGDERFVLRF